MSSFKWGDVTFMVRSASRTAALECTNEFDLIAPMYNNDNTGLCREGDWLIVKYAPTFIRIGVDVFSSGERIVTTDEDGEVKLILPITREAFFALPMQVTEAWITAAHSSNMWFIDIVKKVFALPTTETT